jgi:predicted anti-sigma-YlaC factor YlaD
LFLIPLAKPVPQELTNIFPMGIIEIMKQRCLFAPIVLMAGFLLMTSCSVQKIVIQKASKALSSGESSAFLGDEDPDLIRDALPFSMKMYETLLESNPDDPALLLATAKAFIFYSYAFIQTPAEQMPDTKISEQLEMLQRSKKMYLRARGYLLRALEIRHPGFTNMVKANRMEEALKSFKKEDSPYLYWAGMSWMAAFTTDKFDMTLSVTAPKAVRMIERVLELDENLENGGAHEFFITYYGSLPAAMGGSETKARYHYEKALAITKGLSASTFLSLAISVPLTKQDKAEYIQLLQKALAVDVNQTPRNRTLNIIAQRKAKWYLEHADDLIFPEEGDSK